MRLFQLTPKLINSKTGAEVDIFCVLCVLLLKIEFTQYICVNYALLIEVLVMFIQVSCEIGIVACCNTFFTVLLFCYTLETGEDP